MGSSGEILRSRRRFRLWQRFSAPPTSPAPHHATGGLAIVTLHDLEFDILPRARELRGSSFAAAGLGTLSRHPAVARAFRWLPPDGVAPVVRSYDVLCFLVRLSVAA